MRPLIMLLAFNPFRIGKVTSTLSPLVFAMPEFFSKLMIAAATFDSLPKTRVTHSVTQLRHLNNACNWARER